eukprot:3656686-Prymnesium_polylepis.1
MAVSASPPLSSSDCTYASGTPSPSTLTTICTVALAPRRAGTSPPPTTSATADAPSTSALDDAAGAPSTV